MHHNLGPSFLFWLKVLVAGWFHLYITLMFSSSLLGPVQVLLRSGAGVLELWVTQSSWKHERLKVWDIAEDDDDDSSHVCIVLSVYVCVLPTMPDKIEANAHTQPNMQLLRPALFSFLLWRSVGLDGEKVAELYSVKYRSLFLSAPASRASRSTKRFFFSFLFFLLCSESPPLWIPLSLSASSSVSLSRLLVPWLLPWSSLDDEH